jgi:hypothetical protein
MQDAELNTPFKFMPNITNMTFRPKENYENYDPLKYNKTNKDLLLKNILRQNYQNYEQINNNFPIKTNNCKFFFN